jgi:phosphomannomutase
VSLKNGEIFHQKKINEFLGEEKLKNFINFCLRYIADMDIPVKRGTFIEYRTGLINVSPIGRNCSQEERNEFAIFNKEHQIVQNFKSAVEKQFSDYNLKFSIGGQISFDCFPIGWDKTYCLKFLEEYDNIIFFGDKTSEV